LDNRQYHRSFIILKTQDSGFSLDDRKKAAGYCKMEIRNNQGKIMLYVQDMKPVSPRQGIYDVMLLSTRDEVAPVKLTSIQVPDSGRGEYEIAFDPDSVRESGTPIDQFHAFAIVYRPLKEGQALQYPLIGYSDKRVEMDWSGAVTGELERFYGQKTPGRYAGPGPNPKETPQGGGLLSVPGQAHEKKKAASRPDIGTLSDERNTSGTNGIPGGDGREGTYSGSESPGIRASARNKAVRKKAEQEEAARKKAEQEEAARKKAEQEAAWRKAEQEAARKKVEQEEAARKKAEQEEAARKKAEQEAARRKAEQEAARKKAEQEEAARKKAEQEAARKKAEQEAARKKAEQEEAARKKAEQEEAARIKAEQEEAARKKAEQEEAARIKAEQEEASQELPHFDPPDIRYIYDRMEEQDTGSGLQEESTPDEDILEEEPLDGNASEDAPDDHSFYGGDTDINSPDANGTGETGYAESMAYENTMGEPVPPANPAESCPEGRSYWDQTKDYFSQLFQNNARVWPFDDIPETEWVRVEYPNPSPYSCYGMTNYGSSGATDHYLVGLARHSGKVRYVIYGVPGIYSMVPPMSIEGFSRWLPEKNGYGAGYWLLYIDAISGNVAYPY